MKTSQYLISTQKEAPSEAQIISHQLMLRAGFIHKLSSGLYTWLPLGLKVLQKIERIVREEMNKSAGLEVLMPMVQPAELWQKSGRWQQYGAELLRLKDRHKRDFCLGPTHEEVIANLAHHYIKSYKQLPINLYQIQTKFRDEIRPRFGVMRAREFIMKDAYSFHTDLPSLDETYQLMRDTYCRIFDRIGFNYRVVMADSGSIGGDSSHEFHVLADAGEDAIAFSDKSDYAANIERAETLNECAPEKPQQILTKVATPNKKTIEAICDFLNIKRHNAIKTLIVEGSEENTLIALALTGEHSLNEVKAAKHPLIKSPLIFADNDKITAAIGCGVGSIGVVNLSLTLLVDYSAYALSDFVCGANEEDQHFTGVNWQRDVKDFTLADLRYINAGDNSPDGQGKIVIKRGIEVGHIFKLGQKYAEKLDAYVMTESGKATAMTMGCYGIGISRILAAAIEQNHDENGIVLPLSIAPFSLVIVPIQYHKSHRVKALADKLYQQLSDEGIDVLLDDRKERVGIMFADAELIGIPHRLVLSDTHADNGQIEYKGRTDNTTHNVPFDEVVKFIQDKLT